MPFAIMSRKQQCILFSIVALYKRFGRGSEVWTDDLDTLFRFGRGSESGQMNLTLVNCNADFQILRSMIW